MNFCEDKDWEENEIDLLDPILLIEQFLFEHGFNETLKNLELESGKTFHPNILKMGSKLETILWEQKEIQQCLEINQLKIEEKETKEKLLEKGIGNYAKKLKKSMNIHSSNILCLSFNPERNNHIIATGSSDKSIKITNYETGELLSQYDNLFSSAVLSIDFNPKYCNLLLASSMDGSHVLIDILNKKVIQHFKDHKKYIIMIRWYQDGLTFATASYDHSVGIYKTTCIDLPFQLIEKFEFISNVESLTFNKDGFLLVGIRDDNYLHEIDLNSLKQTKFNLNANLDDHVSFTPMYLTFSPNDNNYLLVSTDKDRIILYRKGNSTPVRNFWGAQNDSFAQPRHSWHFSDKYIYSNSQDNKIYCWEIASQKIVNKLEGHTALIRDIQNHMWENLLGSVSFDKTVKLWSADI